MGAGARRGTRREGSDARARVGGATRGGPGRGSSDDGAARREQRAAPVRARLGAALPRLASRVREAVTPAAGFPRAARAELANDQLRGNLAKATTTIRAKRAAVVGELPDWQELRDAGAAIKARAMATLPEQLERLEERVAAVGGTVHWARDGAEATA